MCGWSLRPAIPCKWSNCVKFTIRPQSSVTFFLSFFGREACFSAVDDVALDDGRVGSGSFFLQKRTSTSPRVTIKFLTYGNLINCYSLTVTFMIAGCTCTKF